MTNRYVYSTLRFVPDPAKGEYVNIGAIVGSDDTTEWELRQVENFKRAKRLDDQGILHEAIASLVEVSQALDDYTVSIEDSLASGEEINEVWLMRYYEDSQNVLQLSPPAPLVAPDIETAFERVFAQLIVDPAYRRRAMLTKHSANMAVRYAFEDAGIEKQNLVRRPLLKSRQHEDIVDFAVVNGRAVQLVQTWSFQVSDQHDLLERIKAWAWTIHDLRKSEGSIGNTGKTIKVPRDVEVDVVYIPPLASERHVLKEATSAFQEINAQMVDSDNSREVAERAEALLGRS